MASPTSRNICNITISLLPSKTSVLSGLTLLSFCRDSQWRYRLNTLWRAKRPRNNTIAIVNPNVETSTPTALPPSPPPARPPFRASSGLNNVCPSFANEASGDAIHQPHESVWETVAPTYCTEGLHLSYELGAQLGHEPFQDEQLQVLASETHQEDEGTVQGRPMLHETSGTAENIYGGYAHFRPYLFGSRWAQPGRSSASTSLYEPGTGSESSYGPGGGSKRTLSTYSQSSVPSSKRSRPNQMQPALPSHRLAEDPFDKQLPPNENLRSSYLTRLTLENTSAKGNPTKFVSGQRHCYQLIALRRDVLVSCVSPDSEPASFVKIYELKPQELGTQQEKMVHISHLPWTDVTRLKAAAEVFTACKLDKQAFNIHHRVLTWYTSSRKQDSPGASSDAAVLKEALALSRTASSKTELKICRVLLENRLQKSVTDEKPGNKLFVSMALADVSQRQDDPHGRSLYRDSACKLLPDLGSRPRPEGNGSKIADLVADFTLLRAFAIRAATDVRLRSKRTTFRRSWRQEEEERGMRSDAWDVWSRIFKDQMNGVISVLRWCCIELKRVSQDELQFLRSSFGREPSSRDAYKRLSIAALYCFFLMRKHGATSIQGSSHDSGDARRLFNSLDNMVVSSSADIFWIVSAILVDRMSSKTIKSVLLDEFFTKAYDHAATLVDRGEHDPISLAKRLYVVMADELAIPHVRNSHDINCDAAARLVTAVVRKVYGIRTEGFALDLKTSGQRDIPPTYHDLSMAFTQATIPIRASTEMIAQASAIDTTLSTSDKATQSNESAEWTVPASTNALPVRPVPWKDTWLMSPAKLWKRISGQSNSSTISEPSSPRQSQHIEQDLHRTLLSHKDLSVKAQQDVHDRVDQFFKGSRSWMWGDRSLKL